MKIVVFDLDETLGYFTEFGIFWDCLTHYSKDKNELSLTQSDFNDILDLYPEFLRPNIINILNYLKNKKKTNDGCVVLLNLKGRNLETVQNLGIHQIANVSEQPITCEKELENLSDNSDNSAADTQTIYDAHKALMSLNDKNLKVFSDVVSYLEQRKDTK